MQSDGEEMLLAALKQLMHLKSALGCLTWCLTCRRQVLWPALWRPVRQLSSAFVHLLLGITAVLLMLGVFFVITAGDTIQVFSSYAGKLSHPPPAVLRLLSLLAHKQDRQIDVIAAPLLGSAGALQVQTLAWIRVNFHTEAVRLTQQFAQERLPAAHRVAQVEQPLLMHVWPAHAVPCVAPPHQLSAATAGCPGSVPAACREMCTSAPHAGLCLDSAAPLAART